MLRNASLTTICALILLTIVSCTPTPTTTSITEETPWGTEVFEVPTFKDATYDITKYGAETGDELNNQRAIQAAIDDCHKNGGGKVIIPNGKWNTSYLNLKSNINLHLKEGAILNFLDDIELYKTPTFTRWEGLECLNYHPFIYARDVKNVAISGTGKIVGNGHNWWELAKGTQIKSLTKLYDLVEAGVAPNDRNCLDFKPTSYLRPSLIQFINCKNVLVEDFEVGSGPMWTVHLVYCENVVARNLQVITTGTNNDGIIPDASKKVLIDNCFFSTGDDCIVIKSGLNEDGWRVGKPSERIVIKNCKTKHGHGGVVIGSEMSGGVRNVYAYDCDFSNTERGLRVKSMKGRGGVIENLYFENITMDSIIKEAIRLNMHYGSSSIKPRTDSLPTFRNFHFNNIKSSYSQFAIRVSGIEEQYIDSIFFSNISMKGKYGVVIENASNFVFDTLKIEALQHEPIQIKNGKSLLFSNGEFIGSNDTLLSLKGTNSNLFFHNVNEVDFGTYYVSDANETGIVEFK